MSRRYQSRAARKAAAVRRDRWHSIRHAVAVTVAAIGFFGSLGMVAVAAVRFMGVA